MRKFVVLPVLAVLAVLAIPSAASAACHTDTSSGSVRSNVSCHITNVVMEKATRHIGQGQTKFRVYARGVWHCFTTRVAGHNTLGCERREGIVIVVLSSDYMGRDYDCSDFNSWKQAQRFFKHHHPRQDPYRLDADHDGIACESLR
jgi:hypothetical protein